VEQVDEKVMVYVEDEGSVLQELVRFADVNNFKLTNLQTTRPNLEDVFIALTGREMRE